MSESYTRTKYAYDSFGNVTTSTGSVRNPFFFAGREYDNETSLYFNRARYYNPLSGRFISEDPLGFVGGSVNFYGYAANSPTNYADAFGLAYSTYKSVVAPVIYVNASITMYGPGATNALAAQWQQWITNTWNQNPGVGKCKVKFNVQVTVDSTATSWWNAGSNPDFPDANNFIYVPAGMPGNPSIDFPFFTGTIPADTLSFSVAHEFGHLLGLWDARPGFLLPWRDSADIMAEGSIVTQHDINGIVGSKPCGCN